MSLSDGSKCVNAYTTSEWFDNRSLVEKEIIGALKSAINDHGLITSKNISSASKRIYCHLKALRKRCKDEHIGS